MALTATWLKTVSGAFCALLLLVFTVAPAIDSVVCGSESASTASAQLTVGETATSQGHVDKVQHDKAGSEACDHGHCHHGASAVPAVSASLAVKQILLLTLALDVGGVPPSNLPEGPTEPPRA